ncbi:RES domain-containing protein [Amphibiibacter pelophylacis]|uniref:RES family NAD+ phosphorylase n=1 Tax=Amphibiibacter pelophylacis TaxID=1799477 RepID=A0ACC6P1F2_9BURK
MCTVPITPCSPSGRARRDTPLPGAGLENIIQHVSEASPLERVQLEREGVEGQYLYDLSDRLGMPAGRLFSLLKIPPCHGPLQKSARRCRGRPPQHRRAGAAKAPGRWNDRGEPVVYTAIHPGLAVLETAASAEEESAALINPRHPAAAAIRARVIRPFVFSDLFRG